VETLGGNQPLSTTYTTIGQAIYDLFSAIDITAIYPAGWALKANYPVKEPGHLTLWPVFCVRPDTDSEVQLDSIGDDDTVTYWVDLYDTFEDSPAVEARMRALADTCRTTLRKQMRSPTPFEGGSYTLSSLAGQWGYDPDSGIRYYRLIIQTKTYEDLI